MKRTHGKHRKIVVIVSAAATILGSVSLAAADSLHKSPAADAQVGQMLAAGPTHGFCSVIAKIDGDLSPAKQKQLAGLGADITRHLGFIHSVSITLPAHNLSRLAALPFVSYLSYDGTVKKCDIFTDSSSGAASARQQYSLSGQGVTVAVLDSGIEYSHWDLTNSTGGSRVMAFPDFTGSSQTNTSIDYCGHGTHVAGIIAGNGTASTGSLCTHTYYGVAPQANLLSVRVLDQNGASTVSTVLSGLQWVLNNQSKYSIRVVNLSLGHPVGDHYYNDPLCQAVEAVWKAGIVVVCAAGNAGRASLTNSVNASNEGWGTAYGSIQSPANDPYVITVGAAKSIDGNRADDLIATYSSRGPSRVDLILKPDIVAPGNKVISLDVDWATLSQEYASTNLLPYSAYSKGTQSGVAGSLGASNQAGAGMSNAYFYLSGTSMAAPVVSGAAALMLQANPNLTPDTIKARLMVAADKWTLPVGAYEAESTANTISGGASVCPGSQFSGGAEVHYLGEGGAIQFNQVVAPSTGTYSMAVAYINGDAWARSALVSVNGGYPQTVSFPSTCSWSHQQVGTTQVNLNLQSGMNTIKFYNPNAYCPDIDRIGISQADPLTFGAGYLNIPAALASTVTVSQPALSPDLVQDSYGNITIDTSVIASKAITGVSTVWGSKALTGVNTIYGSKAITGVSTVSSSKAICGSSVWGDKTICGSSSPSVDLSSVAAHGE